MYVPFIDREVELSILDREYSREGFSLVILYGRRRIGKTRLIMEWLKGKKSVYFIAIESSYDILCREFVEVASRSLNTYIPSGDITDVLNFLSRFRERIVVVFDEFQYIVRSDKSFPSRLMRLIDTVLSKSNLMLILCGSTVSFFEKELLGYKSPLFGRRTTQIKLEPLKPVDVIDFFPKLNPTDILRMYSILGGTPAYLSHVYGVDSFDNALKKILEPGNPLLEEAPSLLRQELREPRVYFSILRLVSEGKRRISEISSIAGIDPRAIHRYITILEEIGIIEKRKPIGFKKGYRIYIRDEYFRFWFYYIYRYRGFIESGYIDEVSSYIRETIDTYASETFQKFVEQHIHDLYRLGYIKTKPIEYGRWWYKDKEIDLIVREPRKQTSFIEVKWRDLYLRDLERILYKLEEKSKHTGLQSNINYYIVFTRKIKDIDKPYIELDKHRKIINYTKTLPILYKHVKSTKKR